MNGELLKIKKPGLTGLVELKTLLLELRENVNEINKKRREKLEHTFSLAEKDIIRR